jgi:hypothetical protein
MILTKEFLQSVNCCVEGYQFALENNLLHLDYDYVIKFCNDNNQSDYATWLSEIKKTKQYVQANGNNFMSTYQVFDPLVGQHIKYETLEEAKEGMVEIAQKILQLHCPSIVEEITNDNGDAVWVPMNMNNFLVISIV